MAPRANWKGMLRVGEVACPVALHTAASTSERIAFHTIHRATGHRVRREFTDAETGQPVPREDQVKGHALPEGEHVVLAPEEIAAAIARTVLFRRLRTVLIRAHDAGMIATTLNFDYEVRPAEAAFEEIPARRIGGEMLDLAHHIIDTRMGRFDPAAFDDRYEAALAELVRAKVEGRRIAPRPAPRREKVVDPMQALRESAGARPRPKRGGPASRRKAG